MNIEEYISSGILEAYVFGDLTEEKAAEVRAMAEQHQEIQAEINRVEETLEELAFKTAVKPGDDVKTALLQKVKQEEGESKVLSINKSKETSKPLVFPRFLVAASVSIAIISSALAFNFWQKWRQVSTTLDEVIAQNTQIADNYNVVNDKLNNIEEDLNIINNADFIRVTLNGTDAAPDALSHVYWNKSNQEVYLSIQNLKTLSAENQYQLWAIIDGKPVDAGVFDLANRHLVKMKNIGGEAIAYAVTIEPKGGSASPSLETMQVYGEI